MENAHDFESVTMLMEVYRNVYEVGSRRIRMDFAVGESGGQPPFWG
jgi:hypothetical protein